MHDFKIVLILLGAVYLGWFLSDRKKEVMLFAGYWLMAVAYAALIFTDGAVHFTALRMLLPAGLAINMQGETAANWSHQTIGFAAMYCVFPLFIFAQYILLRMLSIQGVLKVLAICLSLSLAVLYYQHFIDSAALNPWGRNLRLNGLSSDPNAFSLMGFLMMPLLISGYLLDERRYVRWLYLTCLLLLIPAIWWTGARSGSAASLLFLLLLPALAGIAHADWSRRKRAAYILTPILLCCLILFLLPMGIGYLKDFGGAGSRLASTWNHVRHFGIAGTFWYEGARGLFARLAGPWFLGAPLSGWGPGGFYREYSNLVHQAFGTLNVRFIDNVANHYLMIAADLGLPALFLNLALILIPVWIGIRSLPRIQDEKIRMVVCLLACCEGIFLLIIFVVPPSYFLDVMWVWTAQLAILLLIGAQYGGADWNVMRLLSVRNVSVVSLVFIMLTAYGSVKVVFGNKGYAVRQHASWWNGGEEKNCFPLEMDGDRLVRWCANDAVMAFPLGRIPKHKQGTIPSRIWVRLSAPSSATSGTPLVVMIGGLHEKLHSVSIPDHRWHAVPVTLSPQDVIDRKAMLEKRRRYAMLSINVSRTVKNKLGQNVGVAIAFPRALFPKFQKYP